VYLIDHPVHRTHCLINQLARLNDHLVHLNDQLVHLINRLARLNDHLIHLINRLAQKDIQKLDTSVV
jgi:uncharacterized coiled-coil protein SlyX